MINTKPIRVLIADDQTLFRAGLARLLDDDPRVTVVAQASDGVEAVRRCRESEPDVVLMDIKMPNLDGIKATEQIVASCPEIPVLILTSFEADSHVLAALRAGASGYVLKEFGTGGDHLEHSIGEVRRASHGRPGGAASAGHADRRHDTEGLLRRLDGAGN